MAEYEDPGVARTRFDDKELERVIDMASSLTPGVWFVPNKPKCDHEVRVDTGVVIDWDYRDEGDDPNDKHAGWVTHALLLHTGPDVLEDWVAALDATRRTKTRHRLSNALLMAWVGNNMSMLLNEVLAMRDKLRQLDLLEEEFVDCSQCGGTGENPESPPSDPRLCPGCMGRMQMPGPEARDLALALVRERWHEKDGDYWEEAREAKRAHDKELRRKDREQGQRDREKAWEEAEARGAPRKAKS